MRWWAAALLVLLLSGCEEDETEIKTAGLVGISVNASATTLYVPNTMNLAASGTYSDNVVVDISKTVSWSSSNVTVASVSDQGIVQALGLGSAVITAKDPLSGITASVTISVPGLDLSPSGATVTITGSLDGGDPTWQRLGEACAPGPTGSYFYDTIRLRNPGGTDRLVDVLADWSGNGFLFLYLPEFNPANPALNCLHGNDDSGGTTRSRVSGMTIPAGAERIAVVSASAPGTATGAYSIKVAGISASPSTSIPVLEIGAPGGTVGLSGSLDTSDRTWQRPDQLCLLGPPGSYYFDSFTIKNTTGATQTVDILGVWNYLDSMPQDGFLHVYTPPLIAGAPLLNCLSGNDNHVLLDYSKVAGITVPPGAEKVLVISSFSPLTATGPWAVDAITTPASSFLGRVFDFEGNTLQGWTASGLWHVSSARSSIGGIYSARYANPGPITSTYSTGVTNSGALSSGGFVVSGIGRLEFDYFLANECPTNGIVCSFDKLRVQLSSDGGLTWLTLEDLPVQNTGFASRAVSLTAYLGMTAQLRFFFDTIDAVSNAFEGAYVDNILIY
jgi:hypothetical protein